MYEYKVVKASKPSQMEDIMNKYAKDGWEVVDTVFWRNMMVEIWITFKRKSK